MVSLIRAGGDDAEGTGSDCDTERVPRAAGDSDMGCAGIVVML